MIFIINCSQAKVINHNYYHNYYNRRHCNSSQTNMQAFWSILNAVFFSTIILLLIVAVAGVLSFIWAVIFFNSAFIEKKSQALIDYRKLSVAHCTSCTDQQYYNKKDQYYCMHQRLTFFVMWHVFFFATLDALFKVIKIFLSLTQNNNYQ